MSQDLSMHSSEGKPKVQWVPKALIEGAARALMYGRQKYARFDYRKGGSYDDFLGSILRHAYAFIEGEDTDKESGLCHLDLLAADLAMVMDWLNRGVGVDDRWKEGQ